VREWRLKLAGCEASRRDGFPEHDILPGEAMEGTRISGGAGEEELRINSKNKFRVRIGKWRKER